MKFHKKATPHQSKPACRQAGLVRGRVFAIMKTMQPKTIEKYFFFGLLFATLIFAFFIFRPFWIVLVLGVSFSVVLYPVYEWLNNKLPSSLSSLITVLFFTIVVCGPLLGVGTLVFNQSQSVYHKVVNEGTARPFLDGINSKIEKILPAGTAFDINDKATDFISYISSNIANIFTTALSAFFSFILMLLIIFYFLKDGVKCKKLIIRISPLGNENDEKIIDNLTHSINGVIKGSLLIAIFQGVFVGFGLWIFHIQNGALWGVIAGISSLIPPIGATLVSVPAIIFLLVTGHTASAIGLFVWAIIILAVLDGYFRPLMVGKKMNIPSILILFSILGGISLLGPVGILLGPLTISLLYALIAIYKNDFK